MRYTIQAGDTLSKLAIKFYGNMSRWPEIAAANALANPDRIQPGQTLTIPGLDALPPPTGPTRNEHGELVIRIPRGSTDTVAPPDPDWMGALRKPWMLAALGLGAFLLLHKKPRRRK